MATDAKQNGQAAGEVPSLRTMEDFASYVGLSRPTVSKYFNDPHSVRKSTRLRIQQAVEASGFRPNIFAANLKRRRTRVIGVIIPNSTDPFYMEVMRRVEHIAEKEGYFAFMLSSNGRPDLEAEAVDKLQSMSAAGAIVVPLGGNLTSAKLASLERRIPLVYVDSQPEADAPFVGTDNDHSVGTIVDYLCRSGEPPCYLGMPEINRNASSRRSAYESAMLRANAMPCYLPIPEENSWEFERIGHLATKQAIENGLPTRTLLCANDRVAFGALSAAWEVGLKVGHAQGCDLRIAGHDDHPLARYGCPPLTTVAQNYAELATRAMKQLIGRIEDTLDDEAASRRYLLKGELILRASA